MHDILFKKLFYLHFTFALMNRSLLQGILYK